MTLQGKKVLLTGGHGFLGKYLAARFGAAGASVTAPTRAECDLTRREAVEALFSARRPDIVVHAAGFLGGIHFSRLYPADVFLRNLQMTCHLLEMANQYRVGKLVNIGSACVYSDQLPGPFKEADMLALPMHPSVAYYGFSKQALYFGGRAFNEQFGLNAIHLIPANLYGPGDKFDPELSHVVSSMIPKFYDAVQSGRTEVVCWGTGKTVREFLYVEDCAEAVLRATELYDETEPLNLGAGEGITMRELAQTIAQATGFKGNIVWDTSKPDGAMYKVVDTTRARERLGWTPRVAFAEGLQNTVRWFAQHYPQWAARHQGTAR
jgi:GDP-L-fucose synthase